MVKKNDFAPSVNEKGYVSYDSEGARRPYRRSKLSDTLPSFESDAIVELDLMSKTNSKAKVMSAYRTSGFSYICQNDAEYMRISLAAQDYVCSEFRLRVTPVTAVGVFAKIANKWQLLWKGERITDFKRPVYLNCSYITKKLKEVFSFVEVTLGRITFGKFQAIAWCVRTEEGKFYIPWHSGSLVPESSDITFEENELEEIKRTYNLLRFSRDYNPTGVCYKLY